MRISKLFFIIIFLIQFLNSYVVTAQISFETNFGKFKSKKALEVADMSGLSIDVAELLNKKKDLIVVPHCYYVDGPKNVLKDNGEISLLLIDTLNYSFIFSSREDGPCGKGRLFGQVILGKLSVVNCDTIISSKEIEKYLSIMETVSSFPKNSFFIAPSEDESSNTVNLAILDKGRVVYYDKDFTPHRNILDLLETKYGVEYFQNDFQKRLNMFKQKNLADIVKLAKSKSEFQSTNASKFNWVIVPYCYYSGKTDSTFIENGDFEMLKIDTSRISAILVSDTSIVAYAISKNNKGRNSFEIFPYDSIKDHLKGERLIGVMNFARNLSRDLFFVSLFKQSNRSYPQLGFIEKGRLKFITKELQIFNSLSELVKEKYGTVEAFKHERLIRSKAEAMSYKIRVSPDTQKQWKKILKNDYSFYIRMFPTDTSAALNLFIGELESIIKLPESKVAQLRLDMLAFIKLDNQTNSEQVEDSMAIYFYRKNVYSILAASLSKEEFDNYYDTRRINNYLATNASFSMFKKYEPVVKRAVAGALSKSEKQEIENKIRSEIWPKTKAVW